MPSLLLSMTLMMKRSRNSALLQTSVWQQQECWFDCAKMPTFVDVMKHFFAAEGIKLRAAKGETNGTVKPAETNPVSISASPVTYLFLTSFC